MRASKKGAPLAFPPFRSMSPLVYLIIYHIINEMKGVELSALRQPLPRLPRRLATAVPLAAPRLLRRRRRALADPSAQGPAGVAAPSSRSRGAGRAP